MRKLHIDHYEVVLQEKKYEHKWRVVSDHWKCEICGRTFGLKK